MRKLAALVLALAVPLLAVGSCGTSVADGDECACFRAVECVESCGGPVVQSGCCPCPEGSFDSIDCPGTTGSGGGGGGCDIPECFAAVECVLECGGPIVSSSCCPCPTGQIDVLDCPDAGPDGG